MNNIYLTISPLASLKFETDLITALAKFEGYKVIPVYPEVDLYKYYRGGKPAVIIFEEMDKDPTVVYGLWKFIELLQKTGMIRC